MALIGRMGVGGSVLVGKGGEKLEISICDERPSTIEL